MSRRTRAGLASAVLATTGLVSGGLAAVVASAAPAAAAPVCSSTPPPGAPTFAHLARYSTNPPAGSLQTAAEIVAYESNTLYVMNIGAIDVVDVTNPSTPVRTAQLPLPGEPTSVAVNGGLVAVAVPASPKTDPGHVLFFRGAQQVGDVVVGALPDMVTFTHDGRLLAVANEGEPNSYGQADSVDPDGSVSVITTQPFRNNGALKRKGSPQPAETISFADFNVGAARNGELSPDVRIFGPGASVAQDVEPEYITIADDDHTAWVSLQENNALAELDLDARMVTRILPLGYADHSVAGQGIDASDADSAINIANWPVKGMYMPDGIANYVVDGARYVLTANEGDTRDDWIPGGEAKRARDVADPTLFPDANAATGGNAKLGRLNVTPFAPATTNSSGKLTSLYSYGTRSFSIRDADGGLVWDSGDAFECITALVAPTNFNASNSSNTFDNRSDDKGPEPENVVIGEVEGRQLAFVGLERIGGVMVFDVSDPAAPVFQQYLATRTFVGTTVGPDSGPEGMVFVPAESSPTGVPLLAVGNEVSGTVNIWSLAG
jgi:hypothetical protein